MKIINILFCLLLPSSVCFAQNELHRKYFKIGGIQLVYKDKLVIKQNSKFKIRHTSAQFRPLIIKGNWKIQNDTLILEEISKIER